jgi:hypothetical protein
MSTTKKAAATKPTVKKAAAAKSAPSHPTWVDMIKVSHRLETLYSISAAILSPFLGAACPSRVSPSSCAQNGRAQGKCVRARNPAAFFFIILLFIAFTGVSLF